MTPSPFSLTIHMVSSLDGRIAKKDNSISWFEASSPYEKGVTGENPEEFLRKIDCYIMGSHTYELALSLVAEHGWAYGDKPVIVLTSRQLPNSRQKVEFYSGDLRQLVESRLKPVYKNVWMVGGASLAMDFLQQQLADDIRVTILPIVLGDGLSFFSKFIQEQKLHLKDVTAYKNGMVELWYGINR